MLENRYDDPVFFEKYAGMTRSRQGLSGAGEWPALKALMPDVAGVRMLDLGCGYGWHCAYALEHGAASVTGVDLSERMLARARENINDPRVRFIRAAMEDVDFPPSSFDFVFSSLAFHYIADLDALYRRVARFLAPGGTFLFSCEHPVFTSAGPQDWAYAPDGSIAHFPVDRYFDQGERDAVFLGENIKKYHRTLAAILGGLLACGFTLNAVAEPQPTPEMVRDIPGMADELRRPMMLIVKACKHA